jgi:RHS repeat-associated protein
MTIDGAGHSSSVVYDKAGNVTESFDGDHHLTTYLYDADNQVIAISDGIATSASPVYTSSSMVYDKAGNVIESFDAGEETQYAYDSDDRVTLTIDGNSHGSSVVYDGAGNVTESFDADGLATQYVYDSDERQIATVDAAGDRTTTMYDAAGNVTGVLDPNDNLTQYIYDLDERQTVTVDALGNRTTLTLDNAGNTVVETDADGNATNFVYDADDRATVTITALGRTTMVYDKGGLVTETFYPATGGVSESTSYTYDGDDRLVTETWYQGGGVTNLETFAYDNAGNMTLAENNAGAYTMSYDADDQVHAVQEPYGLALTFTYDNAGNRTQVQDSLGGLTTSVYDADNQLTSVQLTSGSTQLREDLSYQNNGLLSTLTRYSNVAGLTTEMVGSTSYLYDAADRVTAITDYSSTASVLASYTYGYDAGSRLTSETDNGSLETYAYDADNQLTYAGGNNYHYDANGNRATGGYAPAGPDNELMNDGTWTYTYDNRGNEIGKSDGSGDVWTYTYDNNNQMTSAEETTGGTVVVLATYTYDVFGNRIKTDVTQNAVETVTKYGYDSWNPALPGGDGNANWQVWVTLNGSGSLISRNMNGDGANQVLAQVGSTGTVSWFLTDHLGSVVGVTSSTGALEVSLSYDAFGNLSNTTSPSGNPMPVTPIWAGLTYDATLSFYISATRYYDPVDGRWITQDPLGLEPDSDPYRYGGNDPSNETDPSGMDSVTVGERGPAGQGVYWNFGGGTPPMLIGYAESDAQGNRILRTTQIIGGGTAIQVSLGWVQDYLAPQNDFRGLPADLRLPTLQNLFEPLQGRVNDRNPDFRLYGANGNQTAQEAFNEIQGQIGQLARHLATELAGAALVSPGASRAAGRAFALFLTASRRTTGAVVKVLNGKVLKKIANGTYVEVAADELKALFQAFRRGENQARALLRSALGANPYPVAAQAHHILPVSQFNTRLGQKLQNWGINLNSAVNGVLLPSRDYDRRIASIHSGAHLETYTRDVTDLLSVATNREDALRILANIKERLLNGTLVLNNAR